MEQYYKSFFLENHSVILIIDPADGSIHDANNAASNFYGWTREELKKKNMNDINGLSNKKIKKKMTEALKGGQSVFTFRHFLRDKSLRHVRVYSGPINIAGKKYLWSMIQDITELVLSREALRLSEEKFRKIYQYMPVGVAMVNLDFQIMNANAAYCEMLGYTENELMGKHLKSITGPEVVEENFIKQERLSKGEIDHFKMEKSFIHKNGTIVYGILDACLIRGSDGKPSYFLGVVVDISNIHKLEEQLNHALKIESIGCLAGGVAHDYNNMLSVIIGNAEYSCC